MNVDRTADSVVRPASASRSIRWLGAALVLIAGTLAIGTGVAHAGLVAGAGPTFPVAVTVGNTSVAATIEVRNDNTPPNVADANTVCNAGDPLPCPAGDPGITLIPSCGQLGGFSVCTAAGADPDVYQLPATAVGVPSVPGLFTNACAGMIFAVTPIDPIFGQLRFTPQPAGTHVMLPGAGSICRIGFTFDVLKVPTKDQNAIQAGVQTVQIVDNTQFFGQTTASGRGTSSGTTVARAQPTLATTASPTILLGGQVTDTAVVSGLVNPLPGATIDFRLYGPNDANCANPPVFQSLGVPYPVAGGPVASLPFTPTAAGVYRWRATYSGDANNLPATGPCNGANENVTVGPAVPALATTASPTILLGGQLTDTAVVTGRVNPVAGATIDFRLYGPDDATCANPPVFESLGVPYPVAGGPVPSAPFTPTVAGVYRWRATYSGDANNIAVTGPCNGPNENVTVGPVGPALATTASPTILLGGQLTDTAVVTGRVNPVAGATIDFRLYGPDDATCANPPVFESLGVPYPVVGGPVASAAFTPTVAGVYRWRATYSGDINNIAVTGPCNGANENVTVTPAVPTIATTASGTIVLGGQLTDIAVVSGRVNPLVGATVDFRLYGPNDATCSGAPVFESLGVPYPVAGGPVSSGSFTPTAPGVYRWRATYSGDANNTSVVGPCNDVDENVTVTPPTPAITTTASPNVVLGAPITDTAVVTGLVNSLPGATVTFRLYGPDDDTCSRPPIHESVVPYPVAGGPVTAAPFTPSAPGVYRWRGFFSGDANNNPVAGACNDVNETVVVLLPPLVLPIGELPATR